LAEIVTGLGVPLKIAQAGAEAIGRHQRDGRALELETDAGQEREHLVASGRGTGLRHGGREVLGLDGSGRRRHLGQLRVLLDGHRGEAEPCAAADDLDLRALERHVDRLAGQGLDDLGEQTARDKGPSVGADLGRQRRAGRGLVVESGKGESVRCRLDQQTGQDRDAGAGGQAARGPRDSVSEGVALDTELHVMGPFRGREPSG
jgi:hypothetical protein